MSTTTNQICTIIDLASEPSPNLCCAQYYKLPVIIDMIGNNDLVFDIVIQVILVYLCLFFDNVFSSSILRIVFHLKDSDQ